ncbi:MAG: hypothetical protein RLZZ65_1587 [Bacteroidota bacterium]|jgi:hypothetical protein
MLKLTAQSQRLQIIIEFLKDQPFERASFTQILDFLKTKLPVLGLKPISRRSLEADLQLLRLDPQHAVQHIQVARKHYYQLSQQNKAELDISNDLVVSMLQQIARNLGISPLEAKLENPISLEEKLVFSFSGLNDEGLSFKLASTCLQAIDQQYLIQFLYKPAFTTYRSRFQVVAPLQVRFYEGRFYLVACEWSEVRKQTKSQLKVFAFDLIEDFVVVPALAEREDGREGELQHFHWAALAHDLGLRSYFKHCLGVARFKESAPEIIRLKFTDWAINYVKARRLHSSQRIVVDHPNYLVIELYIYRTYELNMLLSRFRDYGVEVR